jgi:citrate lyase subunit beta/citryl-CoA lyase
MSIPRSFLFVPGDRPERFDKALASGAHAVILDLEDAVQPDRKPFAREQLRAWLSTTKASVYVRINPLDTAWGEDDLDLSASSRVQGLMVPKAGDAVQLRHVHARLQAGQGLIPLVESVSGFFAIQALANAPGVTRLAFGTVDFMADAGISGDGQELDSVRTQMVLASRAAGLQAPLDGVCLSIDDEQAIALEAQRSRRWGMGGKLCIHPRQVGHVNRAFEPTAAEIAWAHEVVQALEHGALGAVAVRGKLVDKPVLLQAQQLLAQARTAI